MIRNLILLALVTALALMFLGCELEADREEDVLPQEGVGETFKIYADDIGLIPEIDETGNQSGRFGFYWDVDQDADPLQPYTQSGLAKNMDAYDRFYQLKKPLVGITALGFGDDGYASGAAPIALAMLNDKEQHYEIPLKPLTEWVNEARTLGYIANHGKDQPDTLVYMDRVGKIEMQAPLNGETMMKRMNFRTLGKLDLNRKSVPYTEDQVETVEYPQVVALGDVTPFAFGDKDTNCGDFGNICEQAKGSFASGWSVTECQQKMFNYYKSSSGAAYVRCLQDCGNWRNCHSQCREENMGDEYGCGGAYAPDALDGIIVYNNDGQISFGEQGDTITGTTALAVFMDYADADCGISASPQNLGWLDVTVRLRENSGTISTLAQETYELNDRAQCSSFEDGNFYGVSFDNPLPSGTLIFDFSMRDATCDKSGRALRFEMNVVDSLETDNGIDVGVTQRDMRYYGVFSPQVNRFNFGKGFLAVESIPASFVYELSEFDLGIIQGYLWSYVGNDEIASLPWDEFQGAIFGTTENDRGTKYDESDDIQASAFYIDQPLMPGLFTFYGDAGWNLYPKGPSGAANEDQPFIRGDFETTEIHMPMKPAIWVDPKYTGCAPVCSYYIDMIYDKVQDEIDTFGEDREAALGSCQTDFRDEFWSCRINCWNKADSRLNGCISIDECLDECPSAPSGGNESYCDGNNIDELLLNFTVDIDPAYLENCTYLKLFYPPDSPETAHCTYSETEVLNWNPVRVGIYAITAGNTLEPLESWPVVVDAVPGQSQYKLSLPYGPKIPNYFLPISTESGATQGQMYLAIYNDDYVLGSGFYGPDANADDDYVFLLIYAYNWVSPSMVGWSLGTVSGNSITGFVNPLTTDIRMTFGDLRAISGMLGIDDFLSPGASRINQ